MQIQEDKAYDDINVTPMLDLAYVLLVIFIIMTTASVQGIKVNLPKASNSPSLAKPKTKAITVTEDGRIFLDAYPVTMVELEQRMRDIKAATPDVPVVIKGCACPVRESHGRAGTHGQARYHAAGACHPAHRELARQAPQHCREHGSLSPQICHSRPPRAAIAATGGLGTGCALVGRGFFRIVYQERAE